MRKSSRHPLITLFVVFAFLAQASGLSGCGEAEKAYKEATGQTVVDDSVVRAKLAIVNQMSDSVYDKIELIAQDAAIAEERADAEDADGMMAAIDRMSINGDAMMSSINELSAAEETLQKQKDAARQGGPEASPQVIQAVLVGAVIGAVGLYNYLKPARDSIRDKLNKRDAEQDPLKAAEHQRGALNDGKDMAGKLLTTIYTSVAGAGGKVAGLLAKGWVKLTDTGGSGATEPKVIASSQSCASTPAGTSPTDTGCKLYIGKATTTGNKHTLPNFPVDKTDITIFPKNVARVIIKGVTTAKDAITELQSALIKISDATAKNVKASDAGTYTAPTDGDGDTTPPVSDPLPWSYSGTTSLTVRATADYGNHGTVECTVHPTWSVTLNADGSLTGSGEGGYYVQFDGNGNGDGCGDYSISSTFTGTHSNGYYSMTSNIGKTTSGSYTASSLSGTGSYAGTQALSNGQTATTTQSWITTLYRK